MLPSELVKNTTKTELEFIEYSFRKHESDVHEKNWYVLNRALGTLWERTDFTPKERTYGAKQLEQVWYPLSVLLSQQDLKKVIKGDFVKQGQQIGAGEYTPGENEEIVNLGTKLTPKQFIEFMNTHAGGMAGPKPK